MSYSYYAYVGAFLELPDVLVEKSVNVHTCPNLQCSLHKKPCATKHCPECGSKGEFQDVLISRMQPPDVYSYDNSESLCSAGELSHIVVSNVSQVGYAQSWSQFTSDSMVTELTPDIVAKAIQEFSELSKVFRDEFSRQHGVDLPIKFGTIVYSN